MNGWYVGLMMIMGVTLSIRSLIIIQGHPKFLDTIYWVAILGIISSIVSCGFILSTATYTISPVYLSFIVLFFAIFLLMPFLLYIGTLPVQKQLWGILSRKMGILRVKKLPKGFALMRKICNHAVDYALFPPAGEYLDITYVDADLATMFPSRKDAVASAINKHRYVIVF